MNIILVACTIFALQSILSFIQIFYYQKYMQKITQQYSDSKGYHLYSAMERKKFGSSAIAVIVVDKNNIVKECQVLQGKSIFARFKTLTQFHGLSLSQILNQFDKEKTTRKLCFWEKAIVKTSNNCRMAS